MPGDGIPRGNVPTNTRDIAEELWQVMNEVLDYLATELGGPTTWALIAGGVAGNHTVTGIATTDTLVVVLHNTAGALADLTSEFTIDSADTIDNTAGTDTSSDDLLVAYQSPNAGTVPTKMSH